MPIISAVGRCRQENHCKSKASLDFIIKLGHLGLHSKRLKNK